MLPVCKLVLISLMVVVAFPRLGIAQGKSSDQILKYIFENNGISTEEQQYEDLKELRLAAINENHEYNYNFALTSLSIAAFDKKDKVSFSEYTEEAFRQWQSGANLDAESIFYTASQAVTLESIKGNNQKSLDIYFLLLDAIKRDTSSSNYLTTIYTNLASSYRSMGDIESAIFYNDMVIEELESGRFNAEDADLIKGTAQSIGGHAYRDKQDYQKAIEYYSRSLESLTKYNSKFKKDDKLRVIIEANLGIAKTYLEAGKFDLAKGALKEAQRIQEDLDYLRYRTLEIKGQIAIKQGYYLQGEESLEEAFMMAREGAEFNKKFPSEARIAMYLADCKKTQGQLNSALILYQRALQHVDSTTNEELHFNPEVDLILHPKQALEILEKKAEVASGLYHTSKDQKYFNVSASAYQTTVELLDKMKVNFLNKDTKYFIASNAALVYDKYIKLLAEEYRRANSEQILSEIYLVSEKNKSTIAFNELEYKYELANSKIPDSIKIKYRDLKIDIGYYERLLDEAERKKLKVAADITTLKNLIFDLNEDFITLDQKINREYGDDLKSRERLLQFPTMTDIRGQLNAGDLFVEVFQSKDNIYLIVFDQYTHQLIELPITELSGDLELYIQSVSQRPEVALENDKKFLDLSQSIFEVLMKPVVDRYPEKSRVLIVPDGLLSSISFESLIPNASDPYHFFIHDVNITYLYGSRQLLNVGKGLTDVNVLSLAPQFGETHSGVRSCSRDSLGNLPFAKKECEFLSENFEGSFFFGQAVNRSGLLDKIGTHEVIHLATHACLNDVNPMLNEIHFSDAYLTNKEIENQLASPELIVLGACNTANGKYIKGQGLQSLSKGFLQAGCKCIQSSLWEIDDYASSEIIKAMFINLKEGTRKSEALRKSKLSFLEEADGLRAHPYFWSGIIQTGDDSPLFKSSLSLRQWMINGMIIVTLLALLLMYGLRRRNVQSS